MAAGGCLVALRLIREEAPLFGLNRGGSDGGLCTTRLTDPAALMGPRNSLHKNEGKQAANHKISSIYLYRSARNVRNKHEELETLVQEVKCTTGFLDV